MPRCRAPYLSLYARADATFAFAFHDAALCYAPEEEFACRYGLPPRRFFFVFCDSALDSARVTMMLDAPARAALRADIYL